MSREVHNLIKMDKVANKHPKNRIFIYVYRYGNFYLKKANKNYLYKIKSILFRILAKITFNRYNHIPLETTIGGGIILPHPIGVVISGNARLGNNVTIMHQVTIGDNVTVENDSSPKIGNNVFIGAGAKIIGGCSIGDNVIVGANTVVTKDVDANQTVIGVNKILNRKHKTFKD